MKQINKTVFIVNADVASGRHVGSVHRNNNRLMKADINRLLAKKAVSKIAKGRLRMPMYHTSSAFSATVV